jgi:hypothetical protein
MHYGARRSPRMQQHTFGVTCPNMIFLESVPVPPEHEKLFVDISHPRYTEMHYLTHRSHEI